MGRFLSLFATVMLVVMLFMATGTGPMMVAEARICESLSHRFKGPCVRNANCAAVCQTEGFPGGHCRGFRRRCFCTKPCSD
ncbi:defensin-like protein P322 [Olea europaea var. sylvestris]|uniref:defensin-like protein P322 n=1 Tax=Olea europaea var. sylvestris TaxID=158386 RepID=UPI000C1D7073|nr:defensin-like protein P322 [Olea europaea var. sylvestris]